MGRGVGLRQFEKSRRGRPRLRLWNGDQEHKRVGHPLLFSLDSRPQSRVYPSSMLPDSVAVAGTIQIGAAAKLTALSIDAIRLYERRALLPKVHRTVGRFRLYTSPALSRLTFIKQMPGVRS